MSKWLVVQGRAPKIMAMEWDGWLNNDVCKEASHRHCKDNGRHGRVVVDSHNDISNRWSDGINLATRARDQNSLKIKY